jgi:hypothetical protein
MSRFLENWRVIIEADKGESIAKWAKLSSIAVNYALKLGILELSLSRLITFFADRGQTTTFLNSLEPFIFGGLIRHLDNADIKTII